MKTVSPCCPVGGRGPFKAVKTPVFSSSPKPSPQWQRGLKFCCCRNSILSAVVFFNQINLFYCCTCKEDCKWQWSSEEPGLGLIGGVFCQTYSFTWNFKLAFQLCFSCLFVFSIAHQREGTRKAESSPWKGESTKNTGDTVNHSFSIWTTDTDKKIYGYILKVKFLNTQRCVGRRDNTKTGQREAVPPGDRWGRNQSARYQLRLPVTAFRSNNNNNVVTRYGHHRNSPHRVSGFGSQAVDLVWQQPLSGRLIHLKIIPKFPWFSPLGGVTRCYNPLPNCLISTTLNEQQV